MKNILTNIDKKGTGKYFILLIALLLIGGLFLNSLIRRHQIVNYYKSEKYYNDSYILITGIDLFYSNYLRFPETKSELMDKFPNDIVGYPSKEINKIGFSFLIKDNELTLYSFGPDQVNDYLTDTAVYVSHIRALFEKGDKIHGHAYSVECNGSDFETVFFSNNGKPEKNYKNVSFTRALINMKRFVFKTELQNLTRIPEIRISEMGIFKLNIKENDVAVYCSSLPYSEQNIVRGMENYLATYGGFHGIDSIFLAITSYEIGHYLNNPEEVEGSGHLNN